MVPPGCSTTTVEGVLPLVFASTAIVVSVTISVWLAFHSLTWLPRGLATHCWPPESVVANLAAPGWWPRLKQTEAEPNPTPAQLNKKRSGFHGGRFQEIESEPSFF